jgi:hypothetical protein
MKSIFGEPKPKSITKSIFNTKSKAKQKAI